jgi:alpha-1,2-mannosyltransferase
MDFTSNSRFTNLVLGLYLLMYLFAGAITEIGLLAYKPLPQEFLSDFNDYERALVAARAGQDPYAVRLIGPAFLYPPPSLLVIEAFSTLPPPWIRGLAFAIINIALLIGLVVGIARLYHYPLRAVWWWFPLALGFAPFYELLHVGQINVVTEFGIFLMFWAELSQPLLSGLGLGFAIITKVTPAVFLGYLFVNKRFRQIAFALLAVGILILLTLLRYGWLSFQVYPGVFIDLLHTFPVDLHSQSLVSKLTVISHQLASLPGWPFPPASDTAIPLIQQTLTLYVAVVLLLGGLATYVVKQREPFFILVNLCMLFSPNIMWYHHYVFIILPLFVLLAWTHFKLPVTLWCLIGLLVIQIDRFRLTTGLLIHVFGHLTILGILIWLLWRAYQSLRAQPVSAPSTPGLTA